MQLAEKVDQLILGRRCVPQAPIRDLPERADGTLPVHAVHDETRSRREAMGPPGGRILQHEPNLATVAMALHARVRAHARLELRDAVPGRA